MSKKVDVVWHDAVGKHANVEVICSFLQVLDNPCADFEVTE